MTAINFPSTPVVGEFFEVPLDDGQSIIYQYRSSKDPVTDAEFFFWSVYGNSGFDGTGGKFFVSKTGDVMYSGTTEKFPEGSELPDGTDQFSGNGELKFDDFLTDASGEFKSFYAKNPNVPIAGGVPGIFDINSLSILPLADRDLVEVNPPVIQGNPFVGARTVITRMPQVIGGDANNQSYTYSYQWEYKADYNINPNFPGVDVDKVTSIYLAEPGSDYDSSNVTGVATTYSGSGTGLTVDLGLDANGSITNVIINDPGSGYMPGEIVTITNNEIGGVAGKLIITDVVPSTSLPNLNTGWYDLGGETNNNYFVKSKTDVLLPGFSEDGYYYRLKITVTSGSKKLETFSNVIGLVCE